jgi:hypothetical protein
MRNRIIWLITAVLLVAACQKITDGPGDPSTGTVTPETGNRLVRVVYKSYNDSSATNFGYDAAGRVIIENHQGSSLSILNNGINTNYERDATGRIMRISGNDPTKTIYVNYIGTSTKVLYVRMAGDSIAFEYGADGRVNKLFGYTPDQGRMRLESGSVRFYDTRGNLIRLQELGGDNGNIVMSIQYVFEYDNAPNPMYADDPVRFMYNWETGSPNNIVKQVNLYTDTRNRPDSNLTIYQYRPDGKPLSSIFKVTDPMISGNFITTGQTIFYYK